jgi:multiple sugar transport system ATP-binding protein
MAEAASVRLEKVSRRFGKVLVLDQLSMELPQGDFVTLLGPSGCGKTTTLNLIAGLDSPDSGSIFLGDRDITRVPPNERGMAIVFQNYALYPHMTVFGNLAFSLKLARVSKTAIRSRVTQIASLLAIDHLLDRRPAQLSGGQQQRVALGRAMVKQPKVFLLDEPFSNLDAALRARMRTEVKRLHLALGTTSIFVTHDQEEAMTLSDLIAVMRDGKVVQYGSQSDIYRSPADTYVATFIGKPQMSLVRGALERHESGVDFVSDGMRLSLGTAAEIELQEGSHPSVLAGFRAEHVRIARGAAKSGLTFPARVELVEPTGSDTFVELACHGNTVTARVPPDLPVVIGDHVTAEVKPGSVHLFDADSTRRIAR